MADIKIKIKLKSGGDYEITPASGLQSFESLNQTTASPDEIFYGVIPNRGSIIGTDIDGSIESLIKNGEIDKDCAVEIWENGKQKAAHIITNSSYSLDKNYTIELSNELDKWQNIQFKGLAYGHLNSKSLYSALSYVIAETLHLWGTDYYKMFDSPIRITSSDNSGVVTVSEYLSSFSILYDYIPPSTLADAVNQICACAQLQCIVNEKGEIKFVGARPFVYNLGGYSVSPSMLLALPEKELVAKNKYTNVSLTETVVTDIIEEKAGIYSYSKSYEGEYKKFSGTGRVEDENSVTVGGQVYSGVLGVSYQQNKFTIVFDKIDDFNLSQVIEILTGQTVTSKPQIKCVVTYEVWTGILSAQNATISDVWTKLDPISGYNYKETIEGEIPLTYEKTIERATGSTSEPVQVGRKLQATIPVSPPTITSAVVENNQIQINMTTGSTVYFLQNYSPAANIEDRTATNWLGTIERYAPRRIDFTFSGQVRTISFSTAEYIANSNGTAHIVSLPQSQFLQKDVYFRGYYPNLIEGETDIVTGHDITTETFWKNYTFNIISGELWGKGHISPSEVKVDDVVYYIEDYDGGKLEKRVILSKSGFIVSYKRTIYTVPSEKINGKNILSFVCDNILADYQAGVATAKATICNTDIDGADVASPPASYVLVVVNNNKTQNLNDAMKKYSSYVFDQQTGNILMVGELDNNDVITGSTFYYLDDNGYLYFFTVEEKDTLGSNDHVYKCKGIQYTVKKGNVYELIKISELTSSPHKLAEINKALYKNCSFDNQTGILTYKDAALWSWFSTGDTYYYKFSEKRLQKGKKTAQTGTVDNQPSVYGANEETYEIFAPYEAKYDLIITTTTNDLTYNVNNKVSEFFQFDPVGGGLTIWSLTQSIGNYDIGSVVFQRYNETTIFRILITGKNGTDVYATTEALSVVERKEQPDVETPSIAETLKWDNGETLKLGDIVRVDKDNNNNANSNMFGDTIFRVTGINYKYDGAPTQDLELQEIK